MATLSPHAAHRLVIGFAGSVDAAIALDAVATEQKISRSALIRRLLAAGAETEGIDLPIRP
jgi:hypothetical protein